jgi:crotonobetainyl-CoA:carnitine CoA-transferase CaiB-like acyl-CoA transferase
MGENIDNGKSLLEGVRILELANVVAGPFAASLLADYGAEVIKVEQPGEGDSVRSSGPKRKGVNLWWKVAGRNKKNITLNLREPRGQEICKQLVSKCDAVIENFRPGALEKWNLGWDQLSKVNPSLIMLRISGFGQTGPYSPRPGFGKIAEAMSGVMQITGNRGEKPISPGFSFADTVSGLTGAFALMTALYNRDALGIKKGQVIDVALFESIFRLIEWQVTLFDQLGLVPERNGARMALGASPWLINNYLTKDGKWVAISSATKSVMDRVLKLIGGNELLNDDRFKSEKAAMNMDELDSIVSNWMKKHDRKEVIGLFVANGAVAAPIYDIRDIFEDPQYAARNDIVAVEDPDLGQMKMLGVMPKFPAMPGKIRWTGKEMGAFNQEVYCGLLGMAQSELEKLTAEGIL